MTAYAMSERAALADLLLETGSDAPTLCEGWLTRDLAAHIVLRERRPDAGLGLAVPLLAGWTQSVQADIAGEPWDELVAKVRRPHPLSPLQIGRLHELVNFVEFLVHHEDVRRAQPGWAPRPMPPEQRRAVWGSLKHLGERMYRRSPVGVVLRTPEGRERLVVDREPHVVITGEPVELLLHAFGRRSHAHVDVTGDPAAVRGLADTSLDV